jgi:hypothetical protein
MSPTNRRSFLARGAALAAVPCGNVARHRSDSKKDSKKNSKKEKS